MLKDIVKGGYSTEVNYELVFDDGGFNGLVFDCDENGNLPEDMNPAAKENYAWAMQHPEKFVRFNKVIKNERTFRDPDKGTCKCGATVWLQSHYYGACQCDGCGQWYNLFGQELNPPETWNQGEDW